MAWFPESASRGALWRSTALAAAWALGAWSALAADPETDRWFARHTEARWRPLAEKYASARGALKTPVENLALPLDYHGNGRIRAVLRAAKAQMLPDGTIFAQDVRVDLLTEDGQPDGELTAEGCLFDRAAKHGYCEGLVGVVKGTDRLKGRDMYFSIAEQFIKILSECEIRTRRIPLKLGRLS